MIRSRIVATLAAMSVGAGALAQENRPAADASGTGNAGTIASPPPSLIEYQIKLSQFEQAQEALRREMEMMRARMEYTRTQREFEQFMRDAGMPTVVAIFRQGEQAHALLREASGALVQAGVGQKLSPDMAVSRIEPSGVWVSISRRQGKKVTVEEVMLKVAAAQPAQQTQPGQMPAPPVMPPAALMPPVVR